MKKFLVLFLFIFSEISFSETTIIAIVNDSPVLLSSFENEIFLGKSYEEKIELINIQIDTVIQLEKAKEFNILPNDGIAIGTIISEPRATEVGIDSNARKVVALVIITGRTRRSLASTLALTISVMVLGLFFLKSCLR